MTVSEVQSNGAYRNFGAFFGQKRVTCFHQLPQTPQEASPDALLQPVGKSKVFSDWVFDVQILSKQQGQASDLLLAVGLAHNFIQIWDPVHDRMLRKVQCAERCILYALAFHGRSMDELVVASGTVFQQVLLWNPMDSDRDASGAEVAAPTQRLHSHDGVIFKLQWSGDASMLVSVSDDRTVQLWSNRPSDAFPAKSTERSQNDWLQNTTDSAVILNRLQDEVPWKDRQTLLASEYRAVFRAWGHSARLWDVKFCSVGLATTSEDALCKVWDLSGNCVATLQGHMGRHVWRLAVHPSRSMIATGGGDGAVKLWDLDHQIMSTSPSTEPFCTRMPIYWSEITSDDAPAGKKKKKSASFSIRDIAMNQSNGRLGFAASEHGKIFEFDLQTNTSRLFFTVAEQREGVKNNISCFSLTPDNELLLIGDSSGFVSVLEIATASIKYFWKAHESRIMKIWWDQSGEGAQPAAIFTSSADGELKEWRLSTTSDDADEKPMQLIAWFKNSGKCALSALLVLDQDISRSIICGDGRGSVCVFHRSLAPCDTAETLKCLAPSVVLKGIHGREQVAALVLKDNVLLSGGHDGYICSHVIEPLAPQAAFLGACRVKHVGRELIKGMSTIKQLWWNKQNELFVFGFHASQAILHNFSAQYRLFSIECGGWRRPHALMTRYDSENSAVPRHAFLFTPPVAKQADLEVKVHSTMHTPSKSLFARCSVQDQYHGRMTTGVCFIGDRMITSGEDNSVKLHTRTQQSPLAARWRCVSTGIAHSTTVRALTSFYLPLSQQHIVLSGGGKQRLNVWSVADNIDVLQLVCGFDKEDALQDHRILGIETFALADHNSAIQSELLHLVVACNSEGAVHLLLLDLAASEPKLLELGQCSASKKPILSCAGLQQAALLATGSTDGMVHIWSLAPVLAKLGEALSSGQAQDSQQLIDTVQPILQALEVSASYLAHDMGVNCMAIASQHERNAFAILSGGDDQSIHVKEFATSPLTELQSTRVANASGSAIKAIACTDDLVFTGGYDQRVSQWQLSRQENQPPALQWRSAVFSECADIASLTVSKSSDGNNSSSVVVVGQGLQQLLFRQ